AEIRNLTTQPVFTSDLDISGFKFQKEAVGDISIKVDNLSPDVFRADVAITGNDNDVRLTGTYTASTQGVDLDLDMNRFQMKSAQAFTMGQITDGQGYLSGDFKISGTVPQPRVAGDLNFNDVSMRVTTLNSLFSGINERVVVDAQGMRLDRFTITDEKGNDLVVNGRVLTEDYKNFGFDLTVNAYNFRAV